MQKIQTLKNQIQSIFQDITIQQVIDDLTCQQAGDANMAKEDLTYHARYDATLLFTINKNQLTTCTLAITEIAKNLIKEDDKESWKLTAEDSSETDTEILLEMKLFEKITLKEDLQGLYEIKEKRYALGQSTISQATAFTLHGNLNV